MQFVSVVRWECTEEELSNLHERLSSFLVILLKEVTPELHHHQKLFGRRSKQTLHTAACSTEVAGGFREVKCKNTIEMFKDEELVDFVKISKQNWKKN